MADQYVATKVLWADRETGKAVEIDPGDVSAARLGRHPDVSHKLTIPGQVFTPEQVERYDLADHVEPRSDALRERIHAAEADRLAALRKARISALRAELDALEADDTEEDDGA